MMTASTHSDNPIGTALPKWFVTASHGVWQVTAHERAWVPYSVRHAREVGGSLTVCGQFAIGWELFWDMPFPTLEGVVCETCAARVASADPQLET